jgi:hypothetical protein
MGQDGCEYSADLRFGKTEHFFATGWTNRPNQGMRRKVFCPSGKMSSNCRRPRASIVAPSVDRRDGQQSSKAPTESPTASRIAIYMA